MDLVIVESPAKAKTINRYLGSGVKVLASFGHVRDLPARDGSVDPAQDFAMAWEVSDNRSRQMKEITDAARGAERVILATDPDREGEAISWHLAEVLAAKKVVPKGGLQRVTFNAITESAVREAFARPRAIDADLVDAYKARRALDYLVGFTLSPVLWRKLPGARSAGRVQSVALRLIVEREREIEAFTTREYWTVDGALKTAAGHGFTARLVRLDGEKLDKFALGDAAAAERARALVEGSAFTVGAVDVKDAARHPAPPFTTSTLQQEAARKLSMDAAQTMRVAQSLYEDGHITYMRTDGVAMAPDAIARARDMIMESHGPDYVPAKPRAYTAKAKNAQEAHEAIRPTDFRRKSAALGLSGEAARLYDLVWKRAVASQMASAQLERTSVDLLSDDGRHGLRATGTVVVFPGFLALYAEGQDDSDDEEDRRLPRLMVGEQPQLLSVRADQHFTEPPPRFSEASLVKRLEELGIGRPSTYASIIQVLKDRAYVRMEARRFHPEEKGRLVTAFLERFFDRYVSYDFTARMEARLDDISAGEASYLQVLRDFWANFAPRTAEVLERLPSEVTAALDEYLGDWLFPDRGDGSDPRQCPRCGSGRLALKTGRFGAFVACSNYPECRYTRQLGGEAEGSDGGPDELGLDPETGETVAVRSGRFGRYLQLGEGDKPKRAPIPKDVAERLDLELALKLLHLPRSVGTHPETGLPVVAGIGRYGPYLLHDGKYARLGSTDEVFDIGMNLAVVRLAEKREPGRQRGGEPLKILGAHPESGAEVRLMPGRYGAYVTDGTTNATLPKALAAETLTLEEALGLLAEKAAKGGAKPARKPAAKKAAKPPAKKPAARTKSVAKTAPEKAAAKTGAKTGAKTAAKTGAKKPAARRRTAATEA